MLLREIYDRLSSLDAESSFVRIWLVVDTGVDDTRIPGALMRGYGGLFFQHTQRGTWLGLEDLVGGT